MCDEYQYYEVDVTKTVSSKVYIRVPKGEEISLWDDQLIKRATRKTIDKFDWVDPGHENINIQNINPIHCDRVFIYDVYDASHYFGSSNIPFPVVT